MWRPVSLLLLLAVSCSGDDGAGGAGGDPCSGVDCSGHGDCVSDGASATCACDDNFVAEGLTCVPEGGDADTDTDSDTDTDTGPSPDIDDDGVANEDDNCPAYPNPGQDPAACASREVVGGPRGAFASAVLADGRVLLVGAHSGADWVAQGWLYDPADDTYTRTAGDPTFDHHHGSAVTMRDGRVLVIGGDGLANSRSVEIYDPELDEFSQTQELFGSAYLGVSVLLPDGDVLIAGGQSDGGPDRRANLFTGEDLFAAGDLPEGGAELVAPAGIVLLDGRVLLTGGVERCGDSGGPATAGVTWYDPDTGGFEVSDAVLTAPRWSHGMSLLPDGRVLVFGGARGPCGGDIAAIDPAITAEIYDPDLDAFSVIPGETVMHLTGAAIALADGTGLLAGGMDGAGLTSAAADRVLAEGVATSPPFEADPLFVARGFLFHSAALLQDGSVLVPGGTLGELDHLDGADRVFPYYDVVIDRDHDGIVDALDLDPDGG